MVHPPLALSLAAHLLQHWQRRLGAATTMAGQAAAHAPSHAFAAAAAYHPAAAASAVSASASAVAASSSPFAAAAASSLASPAAASAAANLKRTRSNRDDDRIDVDMEDISDTDFAGGDGVSADEQAGTPKRKKRSHSPASRSFARAQKDLSSVWEKPKRHKGPKHPSKAVANSPQHDRSTADGPSSLAVGASDGAHSFFSSSHLASSTAASSPFANGHFAIDNHTPAAAAGAFSSASTAELHLMPPSFDGPTRVNHKRTGPSLVEVHDEMRPAKRAHASVDDEPESAELARSASNASAATESAPEVEETISDANRLLRLLHEERLERRRQHAHQLSLQEDAEAAQLASMQIQCTPPPAASPSLTRYDSPPPSVHPSAPSRSSTLAGFVFHGSPSITAATPISSRSDSLRSDLMQESPARGPSSYLRAPSIGSFGNRLSMSPLSRFHSSSPRQRSLLGSPVPSSTAAISSATTAASDTTPLAFRFLPAHVPWWQQQQKEQASSSSSSATPHSSLAFAAPHSSIPSSASSAIAAASSTWAGSSWASSTEAAHPHDRPFDTMPWIWPSAEPQPQPSLRTPAALAHLTRASSNHQMQTD